MTTKNKDFRIELSEGKPEHHKLITDTKTVRKPLPNGGFFDIRTSELIYEDKTQKLPIEIWLTLKGNYIIKRYSKTINSRKKEVINNHYDLMTDEEIDSVLVAIKSKNTDEQEKLIEY